MFLGVCLASDLELRHIAFSIALLGASCYLFYRSGRGKTIGYAAVLPKDRCLDAAYCRCPFSLWGGVVPISRVASRLLERKAMIKRAAIHAIS
jgi:hypothetical protein